MTYIIVAIIYFAVASIGGGVHWALREEGFDEELLVIWLGWPFFAVLGCASVALVGPAFIVKTITDGIVKKRKEQNLAIAKVVDTQLGNYSGRGKK